MWISSLYICIILSEMWALTLTYYYYYLYFGIFKAVSSIITLHVRGIQSNKSLNGKSLCEFFAFVSIFCKLYWQLYMSEVHVRG